MTGRLTRGFAFMGLGLVGVSNTVLLTELLAPLAEAHLTMGLTALSGSLLLVVAGVVDVTAAIGPLFVDAVNSLRNITEQREQ